MAEHIDAEFDRLKIPKTKTRQRNQDIDRSEKPADLAGEKNKITNDISTLKEKYQKVRGGITFAGPYLKEDKIMIRYNIGEGKNRKTIDISYHEHGGGSKDITELSAHIKEEFKRSNVETVTHKPGPNKGQTLGTLSSRGFTFTKRTNKERSSRQDAHDDEKNLYKKLREQRQRDPDSKRVSSQVLIANNDITKKIDELLKLDPNTILSNLNYQMSNGKLKVTFNSTSDDVTEPNTIEINNVNNEQQKVLMKETQEFVKQIEKKQLAIHNLSRGPSKGGSDGSNRER